ncbi:hypothetical protein [Microbispora sp. H10670]|nr:hypothetical protein [Microbispora sp. H10670]
MTTTLSFGDRPAGAPAHRKFHDIPFSAAAGTADPTKGQAAV